MISITEVSHTIESINDSNITPKIKAILLDKVSYLVSSLNSPYMHSYHELCALTRHHNAIKSALHTHGVLI